MSACSSASSSSVVVLDTAPDEDDTATSPYFDDGNAAAFSWPMAQQTKSTLTNLHSLYNDYGVPAVYTPLLAGNRAACAEVGNGNVICVYADAIRAGGGGLRLPLHDFYSAVLLQFGLAPSQLSPNAWRYMAAFVLLCEDVGVEPMVSVFRRFFSVRAHKGSSLGWHNFKPISSRSRPALFTGKMPKYKGWKSRFFFLQAPSNAPWPCPVKWGKPRRAAVLMAHQVTAATMSASERLLARAGNNGIHVSSFLAGRHLPVGRLGNTPPAAVKREGNAAAEQSTRKRKSPDADDVTTTTPVPSPQPSNDTRLPRGAIDAAHFRVPGGERSSATRELFHMAQMAMDELHGKEQDLKATKGEVVRLQKEALAARDEHAADRARLMEQLLQAKENISRLSCDHQTAVTKLSDKHTVDTARRVEELRQAKEKHAADMAHLGKKQAADITELNHKHTAELRAVKVQCQRDLISLQNQNLVCQKEKYITGLKDMRELALTMYPGVVLPSELKHELLSDSDHEDQLGIIFSGDSEDDK